jgi:hypothetical protein
VLCVCGGKAVSACALATLLTEHHDERETLHLYSCIARIHDLLVVIELESSMHEELRLTKSVEQN